MSISLREIERLGENVNIDPMARRNLANLMAGSAEKSDTTVISDCRGEICFVNTAFERITGYHCAELVGRSFRDIHFSLPLENQDSDFWQGIQQGRSFSGMCVHPKKDGSCFHHAQTVRPFFDENGAVTHAVFSGRDVSQDVLAMQRLTYQANYDSLTGLPNRNLLSDRLQQMLKHATRYHEGFAVAMLDVDQFKAVNDGYGHAVGDLVLSEVGRRVAGCIRDDDTLGRLGGDEFILIFPGIGKREDAEEIASKIRAEFFTGVLIKDRYINISVSIGCSIYPSDGESLQALFESADSAMYREKSRGGVEAVVERLTKS